MTHTRRQFLQVTVAVAGSVTAAACGDDAGPDSLPNVDAGDTGIDIDGGETGDGEDDTSVEPVEPVESTTHFPQSVASGDPRDSSVVLWTRVVSGEPESDVTVRLQLATDEAFENRILLDGSDEIEVVAEAAFDRCVKVRVAGLQSATTYWYRFVVVDEDGVWRTRHGRTRTAPAADDARTVRFAFVSCQDYTGTYYNPYKRLVAQELDFVVHLGDYVYETTGDPGFQETGAERVVRFGDEAGAIVLGEGDDAFFAARSLDNYRDLYRTYRSDVWLQRVHELFPVIALWDDHEFSDDCWGANGTYLDDRESELDVGRRKNANQAWFEFMPVDYPADPEFRYRAEADFPGDLTIWRDIRYGANIHLVATDLRTWRPDHVIAEDEVPGNIVVTEDALVARHGGVPDWALPYVDWNAEDATRSLVTNWAAASSYPLERVAQFVSFAWLNELREAVSIAPLPIADAAELPRGVAIQSAGKNSLYSSLGSRSLAVSQGHDIISRERYLASEGASENLLGTEQRAWFLATMQESTAAWKVWCNEFCLLAKIVDVSTFDRLPPSLKQRFYLSVEDWGGAMNERDALLEVLGGIEGAVAITGDIHAFFASSPSVRGDATKRIPEFVTSAVSSGTYERLLVKTANSDPGLRDAGAAALALLVPDLLTDPVTRPNPDLAFSKINEHGYSIATVTPDRFEVTFTGFEQNLAQRDLDVEVARAAETVSTVRLQTRLGDASIWRDFDGVWSRWDIDAMEWVAES